MEALAITIFLSLVLAVFFVTLFGFSQRDSKRGLDQEALLPFDEGPRASVRTAAAAEQKR